jgi:hypothetical protein
MLNVSKYWIWVWKLKYIHQSSFKELSCLKAIDFGAKIVPISSTEAKIDTLSKHQPMGLTQLN